MLSSEDMQTNVRGRITFIPQDPFGSLNPVFTIGTQISELMKWKSPHRTQAGNSLARLLLPDLARRYPRDRRAMDRQAIFSMLEDVQIQETRKARCENIHTNSAAASASDC